MITILLTAITILILVLLLKNASPKKKKCTKNIEYILFDSGIIGPYIGIVGSMHGNEPAGSITLMRMIERREFDITKGKLLVIIKNLIKNTD